jgi:hypothetical protein
MKYKFGDRVKIVAINYKPNELGSYQRFIGKEGIVLSVSNDDEDNIPYEVRFEDDIVETWFAEDELERV